MRVIDGIELARLTPYPLLADALRRNLSGIVSPPRTHLDPTGRGDALLLMPAWRERGLLGVKLVTVYPGNAARGAPAVAAAYAAFDHRDGKLLALLDGTVLTLRRTAAAAALAAAMLASSGAQCFLVCGTGALAPELVRAHVALIPTLARILVWGRSEAKARALAQSLVADGLPAQVAADLDAALAEADVVAAATTATAPFIRAAAVRPGTHLGLIGAFTPTMSEAEPALLAAARLFADDRDAVLAKGGEVVQAIAAGLIAPEAIEADLAGLAAVPPARAAGDITVFKSVGFAALDLAATEVALRGLPADDARA
ncbi:MAG: ornithine cyclodeaminase family protein [Elioraea sp.]|nr:ornithine cyclodeaminase family protein [Elioraea sp.]